MTKTNPTLMLCEQHPRDSICNVDVLSHSLSISFSLSLPPSLYWIVFLIASFVPRSKENRLCLQTIESTSDPVRTASSGSTKPGGQLLCLFMNASTNIFLKGRDIQYGRPSEEGDIYSISDSIASLQHSTSALCPHFRTVNINNIIKTYFLPLCYRND